MAPEPQKKPGINCVAWGSAAPCFRGCSLYLHILFWYRHSLFWGVFALLQSTNYVSF